MEVSLDIVYVNYLSLEKLQISIESFLACLKKEIFYFNIFIIDILMEKQEKKKNIKIF